MAFVAAPRCQVWKIKKKTHFGVGFSTCFVLFLSPGVISYTEYLFLLCILTSEWTCWSLKAAVVPLSLSALTLTSV